jgi:hypothetical protein
MVGLPRRRAATSRLRRHYAVVDGLSTAPAAAGPTCSATLPSPGSLHEERRTWAAPMPSARSLSAVPQLLPPGRRRWRAARHLAARRCDGARRSPRVARLSASRPTLGRRSARRPRSIAAMRNSTRPSAGGVRHQRRHGAGQPIMPRPARWRRRARPALHGGALGACRRRIAARRLLYGGGPPRARAGRARAVARTYRGIEVFGPPPPLLRRRPHAQMLNILEGFDLGPGLRHAGALPPDRGGAEDRLRRPRRAPPPTRLRRRSAYARLTSKDYAASPRAASR